MYSLFSLQMLCICLLLSSSFSFFFFLLFHLAVWLSVINRTCCAGKDVESLESLRAPFCQNNQTCCLIRETSFFSVVCVSAAQRQSFISLRHSSFSILYMHHVKHFIRCFTSVDCAAAPVRFLLCPLLKSL